LDNSTLTWKQISLTVAEPLNTKYAVSQVLYLESTPEARVLRPAHS